MDDVTRSENNSVSRRTMLKRIGAAGAIAWVTPAISSLTTPAYADGFVSAPGAGCDPAGNCENGIFPCGTCSSDVGDGSFCFTEIGTGHGVCAEDVFCDEAQACQSSSECPKGSACITNNGCSGCASDTGVCAPLCTPGLAQVHGPSIPSRHGLTATNRTL